MIRAKPCFGVLRREGPPSRRTPRAAARAAGRQRPAAWIQRVLLLSLLLLPLVGAPRPARGWRPEAPNLAPLSAGEISFLADAASVLDPTGQPRLRLFLDVPYDGLRFLPGAGGFLATLEVTIVLYDRDDNQVSGDLWTVPLRVAGAADARDPGRFWRQAYELPSEPGKLRVSVRIVQLESGRSGVWGGRIDVPRLGAGPMALSDLILGRCVSDSAAADPAYPGCLFLPGPGREGSEESRVLCAYGEIYDRQARADTTYQLRYEVVSAAGRTVESWNETVPRRGGRGHFCLHPSLAGLRLGVFGLRVEVRLGDVEARTQRSFQTDEAHSDLLEDTRKARALLGYIATNDELVRLESLPNDSLGAFWSDFWRRRDPSPETTRNENLQEFLRRVEYADTHFSVLEQGWNSDMGRIYVRYGSPDQIDRAPLGTSSSSHEVWHYFNRNLRFVFVDYEGFGRFRLVGSERG